MRTLEIIIDNKYKLDLGEAEIGLIYQITDIREYDKRKSSYSYPFTLPGTHNNNQAFGYIYNIQNDTDIDVNKRIDVRIQIDTDIIFSGFLQLNRVLIDQDSKYIQYEVTIYSNVTNLFETIGGKRLCDLDLSEFDHDYLRESVIASWDNYIIRNGIRTGFQKGLGYVYPYINYFSRDAYFQTQPSPNRLKTEFFYPHPYVRTIWDKIFDDAGFSWTSNFLSGEIFNSLIVSPNPEGLSITKDLAKLYDFKSRLYQEQYWDEIFDSIFLPDPFNRWLGETIFPYNYDFDNQDPPVYVDEGDHFDVSTHKYTVTEKCRMSFFADTKYKVLYSAMPDSYNLCDSVFQSYLGEEWFYAFLIVKRNGIESVLDSIILKTPVNFGSTINCTYFNRVTSVSCNDVEFLPGDEIYVKVDLWNRVVSYNGFAQIVKPYYKYWLEPSDFYGNITNEIISEGNPINFSRLMYCESQSSFLTSIIRMFNLYVMPDPDNEKNLIIEPRDDFYESTYAIDWTNKLDRSREWKLIPIPEVSSSKLFIKYNNDGDFLNNDYQTKFPDETFGQYESQFTNNWLTSDETNTLIFANSPLVNENGTDRILPEIYRFSNSKKQYFDYKIRIFYYNGLVNTDDPYYIFTTNGTGNYVSGPSFSKYPYAGYLDSPENTPSIDLNLFYPKKVYFSQTQVTPNNLYNTYWRNTLENIYDKNSKMLIGYFYLTPYDIHILNLRNYIFLDGSYWTINKIDGFDPLNQSLTLVELIKVINQDTPRNFVLYDQVFTGLPPMGGGQVMGEPISTTGIFSVKETNVRSFNIDVNNNNIITPISNGNIVAGNQNIIHQSSTKTLILGDTNEISTPKSSIILGDFNQVGNFEKSILIGDGFGGLTQSFEYSIVVGNTQSGFKTTSIFELVDNNGVISGGITYSIPILTGYGITTSNIFYDFNKNLLNLSSPTASEISFQNITGSGSIGNITWFDSSNLSHSINGTPNLLNISSSDNLSLSVNSNDIFKIGYISSPYVGINNNKPGTLLNIEDVGGNTSLFSITSTSSIVMLNYDTYGVLENKSHIKIGATGAGYILKSPDGTDWKISVDNSGNLIVGTSI